MDQRSYPKCAYCEEYEDFVYDYIFFRLSKQTAGKGHFGLSNYIVEQLGAHVLYSSDWSQILNFMYSTEHIVCTS